MKRRKKDSRTYKNFKFIPTSKLLEIINEPYHRGTDGHDYAPYIEEIKAIYWDRMTKEQEKINYDNRYQIVTKNKPRKYGSTCWLTTLKKRRNKNG